MVEVLGGLSFHNGNSPGRSNMEEKAGGGDMPHRIEAEESIARMNGTGDANEDIHELRKYIMQMMHSEMELMESIKQSEDSISTVNSRIDKLKELITSEKHRSKQVGQLLTKSSQGLKTLSDKKTVVEAKYRQYCETIAQRAVECLDLKTKYQSLRRVIENLETLVNSSDHANTETISAAQELKEKHSAVLETMSGENELDIHRAELQKIRAKKRYIDQHAEQIAVEAKSLHDQHEALKQRLAVASRELLDLDATLEGLNGDSTRQRTRLLEEIRHLRQVKDQSTKKLATKQKKYRVKMKGEISTLKKRVTFVTRELEGHEMGVEDTLSSLAPFQDSRGQLEARLSELEAEIGQRQESIRIVPAQIDDFDASKEAFDLSSMKSKLELKNVEVESAVRKLTELKDELAQLEEDAARVLEEKRRVDEDVALLSSVEAEEELTIARGQLKEVEEQRSHLKADNESAEEASNRLSLQAQKKRQQLKRAKALTTKHTKELRKVSQQHEQANTRLAKEQQALARVTEAEQLSLRLKSSQSEAKTTNDARLEELHRALHDKELAWKRQCLEEEERLKAELEAWTEKVEELQAQLA